MGSPCRITLYGNDHKQLTHSIGVCREVVRDLESKYSRFQPDSILSRINKSAGSGKFIPIDQELAAILAYADTCFQMSNGLFDISSGVLRRIWDFSKKSIPPQRAIEHLLPLIGWEKIERRDDAIKLSIQGSEIDLGGIVKEYAVDRLADHCTSQGICHGLIDLGGDIRLIGPHSDGKHWKVGLTHPRHSDRLLDRFEKSTGAIASSGDYQRYFLQNGRRYCHIMNPKTGHPVSHLQAVSVFSDHCLVAGSAATIAMLKEKEGLSWLKQEGFDYVLVDENGNTHRSANNH